MKNFDSGKAALDNLARGRSARGRTGAGSGDVGAAGRLVGRMAAGATPSRVSVSAAPVQDRLCLARTPPEAGLLRVALDLHWFAARLLSRTLRKRAQGEFRCEHPQSG